MGSCQSCLSHIPGFEKKKKEEIPEQQSLLGSVDQKESEEKTDAPTLVQRLGGIFGTSRKTPVPPDPKSEERLPVLLPGEPELMKALGLGRGVDGTSPTPWLNKTAFQVRSVTEQTIVGTEESGAVYSYVREVTSVRSKQSALKQSIDAPSVPVTFGIDAEYSRSFTKSRKTVGNRVHNRTVSFTSGFDDAVDWMSGDQPLVPEQGAFDWHFQKNPGNEQGLGIGGAAVLPTPEEGREDAGVKRQVKTPCPPDLTFEQRLCRWVMDEMLKNPDSVTAKAAASLGESHWPREQTDEGTTILVKFSRFCVSEERKTIREMIDPHCFNFVDYFRITHYVSAIQLGGLKYEVMSDDQYAKIIGAKTGANIEQIGRLDFSTHLNMKYQVSSRRGSQIGVMRPDPVRGLKVLRNEEAVIGVKIKPLSSLIRNPLLRQSLQMALKSYMDSVQGNRAGPFLIACNADSVFLKVDEQFQVVGVEDHLKASRFYIVPTYDSAHTREFTITHSSKKKFRDVTPVSRILQAPRTVCGWNRGPLTTSFEVEDIESRFTLESRKHTAYKPIDINAWVSGREAYYISTAHRLFKKTSYICLIHHRSGDYITTCVPSTEYRSEKHRRYMVFRLIRPELFSGGCVEEGEDDQPQVFREGDAEIQLDLRVKEEVREKKLEKVAIWKVDQEEEVKKEEEEEDTGEADVTVTIEDQ